jgi:uncharacterized protein
MNLILRGFLIFGLLTSFNAWSRSTANAFSANESIKIPALTGPVVDNGEFLTVTQESQLDKLIRKIHLAGGPQLQILTVNNLQGIAIEDYSIRVAEKWKLGSKQAGNGIIITLSKQEREVRIEVGEGIEGTLTDYDSHKIIQNMMIPQFKQGKFAAGLEAAIWNIAEKFNIDLTGSLTRGSRRFVNLRNKSHGIEGQKFNIAVVVSVILVALISLFFKNVFLKSLLSAGTSALVFHFICKVSFLTIMAAVFGFLFGLINSMNRGMSRMSGGRGYYGGSSWGGGYSGGGFGGGGWSGGGGGFSGGGSSGSW